MAVVNFSARVVQNKHLFPHFVLSLEEEKEPDQIRGKAVSQV